MLKNLKIGTVIASQYTVLQKKPGKVPENMSAYVSNTFLIELDSMYENQCRLSIFMLSGPMPQKDWPFLIPDGFKNVKVKKAWTPPRIKVQCGAIAYKARTPQGNQVAMIQMMAVDEKAIVQATTSWAGFPGVNQFFVGFKPGMELRTEELLEAGLELCRDL